MAVAADFIQAETKMSEKPLFVPLKAEFFEAFASGAKKDELRRYGPRWNETTCAVGRVVTLSRGYGKAQRLSGIIRAFKKQHGSTFGSMYRASIEKIYGTVDVWIACIGIELPPSPADPSPADTSKEREMAKRLTKGCPHCFHVESSCTDGLGVTGWDDERCCRCGGERRCR